MQIQDTVSIAGTTVKGFRVLEVTQMSGYKTIPEFDGILGLRVNSKSKDSFVELAYKQKQIPEPILSFFIDESDTKGELIVGGFDPSQSAEAITWLPMSKVMFSEDQKEPLEFWAARIRSSQMAWYPENDLSKATSKTYPNQGYAIIDTGSSVSLVSQSFADKLVASLGNHTRMSSENGQDPYAIACTEIPHLPNITISLVGGYDLKLTGWDYTLTFSDPARSGSCYLSFFADKALASQKDTIVLGNGILRYISLFCNILGNSCPCMITADND